MSFFHIGEDTDLVPTVVAENGAESFRRLIWSESEDQDTAVKATVWIAAPGVYLYPARNQDETYVVLEGKAMTRLGDGELREIGPGSIVQIPAGVKPWIEILEPLRKFAMVVPRV